MLSVHDEQARDVLQKAVAAGIKNPEFTVAARFDLTFELENFPDVDISRSLAGSGKEENVKALQEAIGEESGVETEIDTGLNAGDAAPSFPVFKTSDGSEVQLDFTEADDKAYLIDFWATWCGPCQGPMAHNQEMLEHHPEWEGKAEIVAVSFDDDRDAPQTRINEKGWTKVTSYWAGSEGWGSAPSKLFSVQGIPTCVLVHKGKILWRGHPSERKLDQDISGLIAGTPITVGGQGDEASPSEPEPTREELEEKATTAKELLKAFHNDLPDIDTPRLIFIGRKNFKAEAEPVISTRVILAGYIPKKYAERIDALVRDVTALFPKAEDRIGKAETYSVARAAACSKCAKALTEADVQYVSLVDAGFSLCEACEATPGEGQGSHKLAHPYSLYRIHPEAQQLDDLLFSVEQMGKDQIYEADPEDATHGCYCDNRRAGECEGPVVGVRWKCAHCRDYDFCNACHTKWIEGPSEKSLEEATKSHHYKWHVFIKKPFPN
mmetsp:Transcript_19530/g.35725  ORF Transcript_19530/g.35725 Transcript_19530/m.35725 type:complete len:494 (+) Transcript_19530:2577-4058(+)